MNQRISIVSMFLFCGLAWIGCEQQSETAPVIETDANVVFDHKHAIFGDVLKAAVDEIGLADYGVVRTKQTELERYLQRIAKVPRVQFDTWTRPQRMAFLLNVYNASTLKLLADEPVNSIKDLGGMRSVWDLDVVRLFGGKYSLADVEHKMIRGQFDSPAVHFALVCGSRSCPPLRREPYTAVRLEAQFAEQAKTFLRDPPKNRVDIARKELHLSPIFKWFRGDFGKTDQEIIALVADYFQEAEQKALLAGGFKIRYTEYDWSVNHSEEN